VPARVGFLGSFLKNLRLYKRKASAILVLYRKKERRKL
jgi:hypothetical protein